MNEVVNFYCFEWKQFIDATIVYKAGREKLNPATWKLELDDATIESIRFVNWIFATANEEKIDYLRKYNRGWKLLDGRSIVWKPFPVISEKAPNQPDTITKEVIKEVIKKQIPSSVLELLDEANIVDMAKNEFQYEIIATKKKDMIKELVKEGFSV